MMSILTKIVFLVAFTLSATCVLARGAYDYGHEVEHMFIKRQSPAIQLSPIVQGLPLVNGTIPVRREIRELETSHPEQWILYILALNWMQYTDQEDLFSYYRLAGIHGAPYVDYNDVKALPGHLSYGYCTHVSQIFPAWHRPYLVLYEQTLYNISQWIASLYPDETRGTFQRAAQTFRIPYWDFAASPLNGSSLLPSSVSESPMILIDGPMGKQTISNPLYSYTFKPLNATAFAFPFNLWNETKRMPTPSNTAGAVSNNAAVSQTYDNLLPSIQQRLYNLFSNYDNYSLWSNEAWIGNNDPYDSVESLHDTIHVTGGGTWGHLAIIMYSSYDPLFWLLHAMLDRTFAMWQVVYNDSYVEPMQALYPTRTIPTGSLVDSQTKLTPFQSAKDHFWNSDTVRNHTVFGYTYEDVAGGNRDDVIAAINRLYTDYSPATWGGGDSKRAEGWSNGHHNMVGVHGSKSMAWNHKTSNGLTPQLIVKNGQYQEWVANIHVNKFALKGSFMVLLFIGDPPEDHTSWKTANNLVGTLGIFGTIRSMESRHIGGTIPMTSAMIKSISMGRLRSLNPVDAEDFLRQNLTFRIVLTQDGSVVDPADVDGLSINVVSSRVTAPKSKHELASWGKAIARFELYP